MFVQVKNENYGYTVATYGDYVVVANPAIIRYDSFYRNVVNYTGSIDYFRYNKCTDEHDFIKTEYKPWVDLNVLLAWETGSDILYRSGSETESGSYLTTDGGRTSLKGMWIDKDRYTGSLDDGFGLSMDMYEKFLVVGSPYYQEFVKTMAYLTSSIESMVTVYNLGLLEYPIYSSSAWIYNIPDPDHIYGISESFGRAVSINQNWMAIGSPYISSSNGMVYMYKNLSTGSNYSWSLYQKLEISDAVTSSQFGSSLELNKSNSYQENMVVGCGNPANGRAYYFELINGSWQRTFIFVPDYTPLPLTFADYLPYQLTMSSTNGFGTSVSTYGTAVTVGATYDREFYEYSGSSLYEQGAVYIFERCIPSPYVNTPNALFEQVFKSNGNKYVLKNNRMGLSVDMFGTNVIAGVPKLDYNSLTPCYIENTLDQLHYCGHNTDLETLLNGQVMLVQKNTSSREWEITNIYQKKKEYLSPYRSYGFNVAIADKSMVVGSPMHFEESHSKISIDTTQSANIILDDITGKSYIYNLHNLKDQFHIGNVFYRNGKIVIMTSGSVFDGLFSNPVSDSTYEYNLKFKGQHTIFEKQIVCTVNPGEFNVSTNPTAIVISTSSLDINKNGKFDYQDLDIIMRYMQYKNTTLLNLSASTDWSSSVVVNDDEISLLNWYHDNYNPPDTDTLTSESIIKWETTDIWMQDTLDLNQDHKIDIRDMNIMWKYFTNRLDQKNYPLYITPSCNRRLFSDIVDYMGVLTKKTEVPYINSYFSEYENAVVIDKTGSYLAPYVTTIGLYDGLDLVATAKLGNPIKITPELPINFAIKIDF